MKKVLLTAAFVLVAANAFAVITNSKHDFSASGSAVAYGNAATAGTQICVYCHTPHNAKTSALIWSRNNGSAAVVMYDKNVSSTLNLTMEAQIGVSSTLCMSCHDGTVAVDSFNSNGGSGAAKTITSSANLGGNMTNDHPIGFIYTSTSADTDIVNAATITLPLFVNGAKTGSMECATCHDVHAKQGVQAKFLRIDNSGSNLCKSCHLK